MKTGSRRVGKTVGCGMDRPMVQLEFRSQWGEAEGRAQPLTLCIWLVGKVTGPWKGKLGEKKCGGQESSPGARCGQEAYAASVASESIEAKQGWGGL